jgi:DNA repair exonuclease SbcCD ATPase subunit
MKIISFRAENIKRLTAVAITPTGNVVEITGRNGSGKTSVLDSIWWALRGEKAVQDTPIRKGAETALIELNLGRLKVTRKFESKEGGHTTRLIVETEDGIRAKNPQSILDAIYGELTFDPLAFTRKKAKEQFDTLKQFVPDVDFDAFDRANAADFAARTDINRRASELRAQAAGIQVPELQVTERVDETELVKELAGAGDFNADLERKRAQRATEAADADRLESAAMGLRQRAADLRAQADAVEAEAIAAERQMHTKRGVLTDLPALPGPRDTTEIQRRIAAARASNALLDAAALARQSVERLAAQAVEQESKSAALTEAMKARTKQKEEVIAAAQIPVSGITFGDGSILLGGVPFDQASDAEQLRASIEIAAAMNPRLRIIRVRDGSLLDEDSMKLLAEMADKSEMQIWVETVSSDRPGAIVLEDGHVRGVAAQAAE